MIGRFDDIIDVPEVYGIDDGSYYTPGFGAWRVLSRTSICPSCDLPISLIKVKQYSENDDDWFLMEHHCNSCMLLLEHGYDGGLTEKDVKRYVKEYKYRR